jgi:hypothetical protein
MNNFNVSILDGKNQKLDELKNLFLEKLKDYFQENDQLVTYVE